MCGISGEVRYGRPGPDHSVINAMNATMARRGPDGEGSWTANNVVFGHRRLAVIDPEGGQQPMVRRTPRGSVALSFAGEIYNYRELRRELQARGHEFRTDSDTEVLLNGYLEYGEGVAEKLRGMYGFAIWDGREDKLMLARDPLGIKPLCYYPTREGVIFASEPKSILTHPDVEPSVGLAGWREHFAHVKTPGHVIWEGMREVKPGTVVTIDPSGIKEQTYWRLQSREHNDDRMTTVENVRNMLEEIVDEQMVADVPLGVLLSGGLDSSTITALAARYRAHQGSRLNTYAVDLTGQGNYANDQLVQTGWDAPFAQEVSALWDTDHTRLEINPTQLASRALRERVIWTRDMAPGAGDTYASRLLLFERLKEHSTVALSGEMADELFGGYPIFFDPKVTEGDGWPWALYNPQAQTARFEQLNPELLRTLDLHTYYADAYTDAIKLVEPVEGESRRSRRLRQVNYLEIMRHTPYLLDFTDRLSAGVGLEVRVPYCDPRLVEYVYNVPWDIKAPNGRVKGLLKDVASDLLPSSVLQREKSGYPWTPHPGYIQEIQRQVQQLVTRPSNQVFDILNYSWLRQVAEKPADQLTLADRNGMNQALELDVWFELFQPSLG
jgi:asparagine synthase (glutamine-hydrolysing)